LNLALQGLDRRLFQVRDAERAHWAVGLASRQVKRLSQLVDTLLDVTRIHAGKFELHLEEVDLAEIAQNVVDELADEAVRRNTPVTVLAEQPVIGQWDTFRIEQVVTNLVSNAIKFGAGRPITISVSSTTTHAILSVRDEGIGISPDLRSHLFERFSRGVSSRHYGGLGLGLYISHTIVDAHRGHIDVVSVAGSGSTFTVTLPLNVGEP
jgi:signal transduction histidine kinase